MIKQKLKTKRFIEWYFSDSDDVKNIGRQVVDDLLINGRAEVSAQGLLDTCCELPAYIFIDYVEGEHDDYYYQPNEVILINK